MRKSEENQENARKCEEKQGKVRKTKIKEENEIKKETRGKARK